MTDHFYDGGLSQAARGVDPRDLADPDADPDGVTADDRRAVIHALARDELHSMTELLAAEYPPTNTDADPEDGKTCVCRNSGCSEPRRDGFDGCCSTVCALENEAIGASVRNPRRDAEREARTEEGR